MSIRFTEKTAKTNLCPWCIHNGSAAEKFEGELILNYETMDDIEQKNMVL